MIEVISFADGIRNAEGTFVPPLVPTKVHDHELAHYTRSQARVMAYGEFIERLKLERGGWPLNTSRNFARRLGLSLEGIEKDERAIKDRLLVHYGEEPIQPVAPEPAPAALPEEEEAEVVEEPSPSDGDEREQLATALEADDYNLVRSLVGKLSPESAPRGKEPLYEVARGLL